MRITFVLEAFNRGGKERRCLQLIQGLNRIGVNDIQVIIINNGIEYPEIYNTSASIVIIDKKIKNLSLYATYSSIKTHIKQFSPDIVHAWGELSMMYISVLKLFRRFKYICANIADCNTPQWYSIRNIISRISYLLADAVVGNSIEGLIAYSAPKSKSFCIYNGFNEARYRLVENIDTSRIRAALNITTKYIVSMFARVDNYKDYHSFVALAREVYKTRDDVTFLAVGGGADCESYKETYSAEKNLRFMGFCPNVEELMYVTDISVLFSNYNFHKEGISNSILESMALGTPVIATNDGGSPEIICHGHNGFLVDNNNIMIAAEILSDVLDDPDRLNIISRNAKSTVQDKFLLTEMVHNYISLYESLLSVKK